MRSPQHVLQLAHIAWPSICLKYGLRLLRYRVEHVTRVTDQIACDSERDVLELVNAFAQRRHANNMHCESVEQILAQRTRPQFCLRSNRRRRQNARPEWTK